MSTRRIAAAFLTESALQLRISGSQAVSPIVELDTEVVDEARDAVIGLLRSAIGGETIDSLLVIVCDKRPPVEFSWERRAPLPDAQLLAASIAEALRAEIALERHFGVNANLNQLAAWTDNKFSNARGETSGTVCSITCSDRIYYAISCGRRIIDTAALELDCDVITFETFSGGKVTGISNSGELFLNATNKPVSTAAPVDREMLSLLGNLLGETVVQLAHRKRAPQVAMRLLATRPLHKDYEIEFYRWSRFPPHRASSERGNMAELMCLGIEESFKERDIVASSAENALDLPVGFEDFEIAVDGCKTAVFNRQHGTDEDTRFSPVFVISNIAPGAENDLQHLGYRLEEWMRRAGSTADNKRICFIENPCVRATELARLFSVLEVARPLLLSAEPNFAAQLKDAITDSTVYVCSDSLSLTDLDYVRIVGDAESGFRLQVRRLVF